ALCTAKFLRVHTGEHTSDLLQDTKREDVKIVKQRWSFTRCHENVHSLIDPINVFGSIPATSGRIALWTQCVRASTALKNSPFYRRRLITTYQLINCSRNQGARAKRCARRHVFIRAVSVST